MEPDMNEQLRNKVKLAEQNTVQWEKEDVWLKINGELKSKKPMIWYYAAASLLIVIFFSIYLVQQYHHNQSVLKIKSLVIALNAINESNNVDKNILNDDCVKEKSPVRIIIETRKNKPTELPDKRPIIEPPFSNEITLIEHISKTIDPQIDSVPSKEQSIAITVVKDDVEPIIGVVIPEKQEEQRVTAREKKVKFRLLRSPDREFYKQENDIQFLFARIN